MPSAADDPVTLVALGYLDLEELEANKLKVTGADVSPLGRWMVVRTDEDLILLAIPDSQSLAEAWLSTPITLPTSPGADGEAVTWSPDGQSLYLIDEAASPGIWEVRCLERTAEEEAALDVEQQCLLDDQSCGCGQAALAPLGGHAAVLMAVLWCYRRREDERGPGSDLAVR